MSGLQAHGLAVERVPVGDLVPYPGNARQGDIGAICQSLQAHGQYRPLVVQRSTRHVLAGNHTLRAAVQLGWSEVAVSFLDVDDEQARRIVLVDNRTNDLATNDDGALAALLQELAGTDDGLAGTGFDGDDLDDLLAGLDEAPEPEPGEGADTEPSLPPADPRSQPGDVWLLGDHRLAVGDATDPLVWEALCGDERADLLVTDPPYGIAYVGKTREALTIQNDALDADGMGALWRESLSLAAAQMKPGAAYYVTGPSGAELFGLMGAMVEAGLPLRHQLIWAKDSLVLGRSDYHYQHEPILSGEKPAEEGGERPEVPRFDGVAVDHEPILYGWTKGTHLWRGGRKQTTLWKIERPKANREHPTMKPVELYERAMSNSSMPGAVVIEPFGGSGTAVIAAENMGRKARAIELDPRYADVIVDRWERHTGRTAVLERDDG
ncbi:MAG: DNA modification methylase [Solirubrobacteraceae bacterium]|nr:DNA modification methylase [Solirubrobacteraceae bacterium]